MKPARVNFGIRPGSTFVEQIILALDVNNEPADLTGCIPFGQVRNDPDAEVLIDLNLSLINPTTLSTVATVDPSTDIFTLVAHGLKAGMCIQFQTSGTFPSPLTGSDFYIILGDGLTIDAFEVILLADYLALSTTPVNITTAGTGNLQAKIAQGQILIPEISYAVTETFSEAPFAGWDLMIQDPLTRRLAPYVTGDFPIKRGFTDPLSL